MCRNTERPRAAVRLGPRVDRDVSLRAQPSGSSGTWPLVAGGSGPPKSAGAARQLSGVKPGGRSPPRRSGCRSGIPRSLSRFVEGPFLV